MTVQELFDRALIKADEEDNLDEYKSLLIDATNSVLRKITSFAKKIKVFTEIDTDEETLDNGDIEYTLEMPKDFFKLVRVTNDKRHVVDYEQINNNIVKVDSEGTYFVEYYKFLDKISDNPAMSYVIKIPTVAEDCLIYGVAAEISKDNSELYYILQNEYNNLLANLEEENDEMVQNRTVENLSWGWY